MSRTQHHKLRNLIKLSMIAVLALSYFEHGCDRYASVQLSIQEPPPSSMLSATNSVQVKVSANPQDIDRILINGRALAGMSDQVQSSISYQLPPAEGLGFVAAELAGDPYLVVRSWLQGHFMPSTAWAQDSIHLKMTEGALNEGEGSLSELLKSALIDVELASFVDSLTLDLGITSAEVIVESAIIKDMSLRLITDGEHLAITATLTPLQIRYRVESSLLSTQGEGAYERIELNARAEVSRDGARLIEPQINASQLQADDANLPD